MQLPANFVALLRELTVSEVRYLLVGGFGAGLHDRARAAVDLELLLDPSDANILRTCSALRVHGVAANVIVDLSRASDDAIVWTGESPRVGFRRKLDGIDFDTAFSRRSTFRIGDLEVQVASLDDLEPPDQES